MMEPIPKKIEIVEYVRHQHEDELKLHCYCNSENPILHVMRIDHVRVLLCKDCLSGLYLQAKMATRLMREKAKRKEGKDA